MKQHLSSFIALLRPYISFPSISTDEAFASEITKQVTWLGSIFETSGFKVHILKGPNTNPVILATYHQSDDLKTKLIYGHYDVQPAAESDGWLGNPFVLREKEGRLIGRGVVDNKGQNLIHIFTAINLIKEGRLGCNLKFLIEGNEETGNNDLADLVKNHKDLLKCDQLIVSDGEILGDTPTIEESLRGGGNMTIKITSADNDLHSGIYGGGIPSALTEMIALLAKMQSADGTVNIPGFYGDVDPISQEKLEANQKLLAINNPVTEGVVKALLGKYDFHTNVGLYPAVVVSGMLSGYIGEGYRNAVPGTAIAKINFRIVASQDENEVMESFRSFAAEHLPGYVTWEMTADKAWPPVKVNVTFDEIRKIMGLQEIIYGKKPIVKNVGGSIPVVTEFKSILGVDPILLSLGNSDCNMHGTEENFKIDLIEKGLELSERLLSK